MSSKCFWFNNGIWEPASTGPFIIDDYDKDMCKMADSCSPGSMGKSNGYCYKWAKNANEQGETWVPVNNNTCFVLDKENNVWLPATSKIVNKAVKMPGPDYNLVINDLDYDMCKRADFCYPGGGKITTDCYKWTNDPNAQPTQWN